MFQVIEKRKLTRSVDRLREGRVERDPAFVASSTKRHQSCGGPCGNFVFQVIEKRKLTRSEGSFERGKG